MDMGNIVIILFIEILRDFRQLYFRIDKRFGQEEIFLNFVGIVFLMYDRILDFIVNIRKYLRQILDQENV